MQGPNCCKSYIVYGDPQTFIFLLVQKNIYSFSPLRTWSLTSAQAKIWFFNNSYSGCRTYVRTDAELRTFDGTVFSVHPFFLHYYVLHQYFPSTVCLSCLCFSFICLSSICLSFICLPICLSLHLFVRGWVYKSPDNPLSLGVSTKHCPPWVTRPGE